MLKNKCDSRKEKKRKCRNKLLTLKLQLIECKTFHDCSMYLCPDIMCSFGDTSKVHSIPDENRKNIVIAQFVASK